MISSILIAGVGNIFLGDDAFGVDTVRALSARPLPVGVSAVDFGIRGFDLAFALLHPWHAVIIVDAVTRGGSPGTLYTLQPDLIGISAASSPEIALNPHGMDPMHVLRLALSMGAIEAQVYVLGCEPDDFGDELEGRMGLSSAVQASVPEAVVMLETLITGLLHTHTVDVSNATLTR
jgi:hydrogenase maturation protease